MATFLERFTAICDALIAPGDAGSASASQKSRAADAFIAHWPDEAQVLGIPIDGSATNAQKSAFFIRKIKGNIVDIVQSEDIDAAGQSVQATIDTAAETAPAEWPEEQP